VCIIKYRSVHNNSEACKHIMNHNETFYSKYFREYCYNEDIVMKYNSISNGLGSETIANVGNTTVCKNTIRSFINIYNDTTKEIMNLVQILFNMRDNNTSTNLLII